jgi:ribosomal protein S18 acetylase RimI-like enzyme
MAWTVRSATPADADVVVEFNRLMAVETEGHALDVSLLVPGVVAALADPAKCRYLLAVEDSIVLGQMGLTCEWSDWRNGWFWWIQSVYVRPEHRRRGVFRSLFDHVQAAARQTPQVIGLRLYVERDNHAAQRTYESLGMTESGYLLLEKYPL